jgi:hypothetical protein
VTFGDVFFCSGQSNMALPNTHSYSAKSLQAQMLDGKFRNLRFFQFEGMSGGKIGAGGAYAALWTRQTGSSTYRHPGNGTVKRTWFNASYAAAFPKLCPNPSEDNNTDTCKHVDNGPFFKFSATCMEFGRSLIEQLGDDAPPIGLIQAAIGGTTIESWSPNTTTMHCQNKTAGGPSAGPPGGRLYYGMVCPFVNMTIAGFTWYQGENNMHGSPGSSLTSEGYGCMMAGMVAAWREIWSAVPDTTDRLAPFGLVTIAPSGSEGASDHLSAFRWAQTANYGVLPNPAMPRTFVAQAYGLNDPWAGHNHDQHDPSSVCSNNASIRNSCTWTNNGTAEPPPCCQCGAALASKKCVWDVSQWNRELAPLAPLVRNSSATPVFMGAIHPRLKAPVGRRLAAGLIATAYGGNGTVTGPTISGCTYDASSHTIVLRFNKTLLRNDSVAITRTQIPIPPLPPIGDSVGSDAPPSPTRPGPVLDSSLTHVCTGDALDCACLSWLDKNDKHAKPPTTGWICEIPAEGGVPRPKQAIRGDIWAEAPITLLADQTSISVATSGLNTSTGGVQAVKFGWSFAAGSCCVDLLESTGLAPCIPGSCGVMTRDSLLPLNPFFATVTGGKCKCPAPQVCSE